MFRSSLRVVEAYALLICWDVFMKRRSFADLYQAIRSVGVVPRITVADSADDVYDSLEIACALYGKQVLCLQRSCVLIRMLRVRGYAAQLTIGSQRTPFRAHAWVTLDGVVLRDKLAQRESFLVMEVC
jgi:Transglutaminase-like superfamily